MKEQGIKSKRVFIYAVLVGAICGLVMIAYGMMRSEIKFTNELKTGSVQIEVKQYEETENGRRLVEPGQVLPAQDVSYIPVISNLRAECYVRARVDVVMDKDVAEPITLDNAYGFNEDWVRQGEFFYYTKPMKPHEAAYLFRGIKIPENWDAETSSGFGIYITADAIQAEQFEPDFDSPMPWGNIEIQEEKPVDNIDYRTVSVQKENNHTGKYILSFDENTGLESNTENIFENFRYFMAGNTFDDVLKIKNEASQPVKISFRTECGESSLLKEGELEITCDGETYYKGDLISDEISQYEELAVISSGNIKDFDFRVTLPEDSDNVYSAIADEVCWKFKAELMDTHGGGSGAAVQTGDDMYYIAYLLIALMAALTGVLVLMLKTDRRETKQGKQ